MSAVKSQARQNFSSIGSCSLCARERLSSGDQQEDLIAILLWGSVKPFGLNPGLCSRDL